MASTGTTAVVQNSPTAPAVPRARSSRPRGGARGGRGGAHESGQAMAPTNGQRGGRRGGPGGARGQREGFNSNTYPRQPLDSAIIPDPLKPPPPGLGGGGSFGGRLTEDAQKKEGEGGVKQKREGIEDVEAEEMCFICASPVDHNSVAPCNHRICHICALRLRALYKTNACAHCRVSFPTGLCHIHLLMSV